MAYTFLRDSMYADFVPLHGVGAEDRDDPRAGRRRPGGSVARDDVAEVAAAVLLADGAHDGRTYDLTGPEALDLQQAADLLTDAHRPPVRYVAETLEEAYRSRRAVRRAGLGGRGLGHVVRAIAAGELAQVSDAVPALTGHQATSLRDLLTAHPELYAHLA